MVKSLQVSFWTDFGRYFSNSSGTLLRSIKQYKAWRAAGAPLCLVPTATDARFGHRTFYTVNVLVFNNHRTSDRRSTSPYLQTSRCGHRTFGTVVWIFSQQDCHQGPASAQRRVLNEHFLHGLVTVRFVRWTFWYVLITVHPIGDRPPRTYRRHKTNAQKNHLPAPTDVATSVQTSQRNFRKAIKKFVQNRVQNHAFLVHFWTENFVKLFQNSFRTWLKIMCF